MRIISVKDNSADPVADEVEYFIPLKENGSNYFGVIKSICKKSQMILQR